MMEKGNKCTLSFEGLFCQTTISSVETELSCRQKKKKSYHKGEFTEAFSHKS